MTELPAGTRQDVAQKGGLSNDTRALMLFEANKKTALVAYLLWFFVGILGGHNFYLKRTGVAVTQLILSITVVGLVITVVWVLVDALLIPGWIRNQSNFWRRGSELTQHDHVRRSPRHCPRSVALPLCHAR